ncbi:hypothetical protein PoB_007490600 [Plakobranchus ocellatus]|uniref:Uncharacterized protein n=1 Tax=Plakobranchus ocellatus TaxID=259542 RepID=A0AAV4DWX8_9GAST|nr:hypothetical protein PoB_007490600 [Plakobranchus ocellatus]
MNLYIVIAPFIFLHCFHSAFTFPRHASCNVEWNVGENCKSAAIKIVNQIRIWNNTDCGTGEKCRYGLDLFDGAILKARHVTPHAHYVDFLIITFEPNNTECAIRGLSNSGVWYAYLDQSTNYCNLHNLITGSHLDKTPHYHEKTSDSTCTQYSTANCEKY